MKFTILYGPNFSQENGINIFNVSNTNNVGTIRLKPDWSEALEGQYNHRFVSTNWKIYNQEQITEQAGGFSHQDGSEGIEQSFGGYKSGEYSIKVSFKYSWMEEGPGGSETITSPELQSEGMFRIINDNGDDDNGGEGSGDRDNKVYVTYKSKILDIDTNTGEITTEDNFDKNTYLASLGYSDDIISEAKQFEESEGWAINYNSMDSRNLNVLLNIRGNKSVIVNSNIDAETTKLDPYSVVLKTYEPLPEAIFTKDKVNVVKEMIKPVRDTIRLVPFNDADLGDTYLYQPNDKSPQYIDNLRTSNKTQEDLLTSDNYLSGSLFNDIISGSNQADINVDYNDYGNFSTFGSVRKRLENFWTKMERYEYYSKESGSLAALTASAVFKSEIVKNEELKNNIVNNFDHFEKYLFFESSSANTSSFGLEFDTSWPKENSTKPHNVLSVSSSAVSTWYNNNIISASNYDQNNPNRLINLIPEYLKRDDNTIAYNTASYDSGSALYNKRDDASNKPFLDFLDMTGHYFDNMLIYIKAFEDIYNRRENLDKGLSKDLVWAVSNAFGWRQPSGKELIDLHRYYKGQFLSGSATSSAYSTYSVETEKDLEREVWNRILTSMPYILKTKGTKESIQALVNAYGIPPSILRINEYGGPDNKDYQPTFDIQQRFTKALDFKGSQYILSQWKESSGSLRTPDTIEFRFRTPSSSNQVLLSKDNEFLVRLKEEGSITDNKGRIEFILSSSMGTGSVSSSLFPVYNNEFWSVGITREKNSGYDIISDRTTEYNVTESLKYNLYVKQYESGRSKIVYDSATSMTLSGSTTGDASASALLNGQWTASGNLYWGSTGSFGSTLGSEFTGSLQELRLWNAPLTESAFNNHTRAPKTINGNHASASWTDLVFRLRLDENKNLSTSSGSRNVAPDQTTFAATSSAFQTGSAVGFTANTYVSVEQEEKRLTPNIGLNRKTNTKVRIEQNYVPTGSDGFIRLSPDTRKEISSYDTMPLDSNKVGIFFSPTDVVNQDIIESLADLDFEQEIGDPRDQKKLFYRGLKKLADSYFQKYSGTNNFWDYMRLVKYYDQAIFEQIKKVIPARVNFNFGLLVEPTILERSKNIMGKTPSIENVYKSGEINVGLLEATQSWRRPVTSVTSSYTDYTGILSESFNREPSVYLIGSASLSSSLDDYRYLNTNIRTKEVYYLTSSISERNYDITLTPGLSSSVIYEPEILFNEAIMPNYSSSIEHPILKEREIFYTSSTAVGTAGVATGSQVRYSPLSSSLIHAYSSSLKAAEYQPLSDYSSGYRRSVFEGVKNTIDTTIDGKLPIEVKASQGTAVITRTESGGKKLEVVRKK